MSTYENAYLELNRIIIRHPILEKNGVINIQSLQLFHEIVMKDIESNKEQKEKIYTAALKELLTLVKRGLSIYTPYIHKYKLLKKYIMKKKSYSNTLAAALAKSLIRLKNFFNKYA